METHEVVAGHLLVQSIAEGRFKLGSLKMGKDKIPSILFCKLANLEHAYMLILREG